MVQQHSGELQVGELPKKPQPELKLFDPLLQQTLENHNLYQSVVMQMLKGY